MKKNNVFKKTFLIVVLAVIPLMIVIGAASWIMLSEERIKPQYNPNSAFYQYLNGQEVTYDGSSKLPSSANITIDSNVTYKYRKVGETTYTTGAPTNAGEYYINFSSSLDETEGGYPSSDVYFKINKATVLFESIECSYPDSGYYLTSSSLDNITYNAKYYFIGINSEKIYVNGTVTLNDVGKLSVGTNAYNYTFTPTSVEEPYDINSLSYESQEESVNIITYATVTFLNDDPSGTILKYEYIEYGGKISSKYPFATGIYATEVNKNLGSSGFNCWYYGQDEWDRENDLVYDDITLIANWYYYTHTLEFVNISLNQDDYTSTYLSGTSKLENITIKDLPIVLEKPTSTIKYFRRWNTNEENTLTITSFINGGSSGKVDTYTSYWWDIIQINNIEFNHSDFTTTRLTYETVKSSIISIDNITVLDQNHSLTSESLKNILTVTSTHNGYYYYGDSSVIPQEYSKNLKQPISSYFIGSTYLSYISFNSVVVIDNFTGDYILPNGTCKIIVSYKTAIYNSTNYTIENAFAAAGTNGKTITLNGDSTNSSSYVETCFSNIDFSEYNLKNYSLNYELNNTTLNIPCDSSQSINRKEEGSDVVFSALTIPNNISINVSNASTINVCGYVYQVGAPSKTTLRGVLMNEGNIFFQTKCSLYSYGYVKGSGEIHMYDGSVATDCIIPYDWPGGNTASSICEEVFPTNAWSAHNIACNIYIYAGAELKAYLIAVLAKVPVSKTITIIGESNCLFIAKSGYILKKATPANIWAEDSDSYKALYSMTGSNQIAGQKEIIEIYGDYTDSSFGVEFSVPLVMTIKMQTSKTVSCPLGFCSVIVKSGHNLNLTSSDYLFLPGTFLEIESGATVTTNSGIDLSFECLSHINDSSISSGSSRFSKYIVDTFDAKCIVNGTLTVNGNIGGMITTSSTTGTLKIVNSTGNKSSFLSLYHAIGSGGEGYTAYKVTDYFARGYINSTDTISRFNSGTYYSDSTNPTFWTNESSHTTENLYGTLNEKYGQVVDDPGCITSDTLITLADGTQKRIDELTGKELILAWNHETGRFEPREIGYLISHDIKDVLHTVTKLIYSNGESVKIIGDHTFYDNTLGKYIILNQHNVHNYIGHTFVYFANGSFTEVTLTDVEVYEELTRAYSIESFETINSIANGILSATPYLEAVLNAFEIDKETLQYVNMKEDIEKYGTYTYEDLSEHMTLYEYNMVNAQYFKVSIGKGEYTWEQFLVAIEIFRSLENDIV